MMSIKLCWQILHISSVTLHPEWNLSVTAARHPCFTPRCSVLHPHPGRTHEGVLAPAEERLMERWRQEGRFCRLFLPRCRSGSYVTLLCVCLLPASCCHSAFLIPLLYLPHGECSPYSLSMPFDPKTSPVSFLFILSQTPGVISSSFPKSCFLTLNTFYQCFSHLWPYFLPAISYFAAGKDNLWF